MTFDTDDLLRRLTTAPSGIAEFHCWYANRVKHDAQDLEDPEPFPEDDPMSAVDRCVDLHERFGYTNLFWAIGRSTLFYRSSQPLATPTGWCSPSPEDNSPAYYVHRALEHGCPLRRALELSEPRGMTLWARLTMNRHYGSKGHENETSRFSRDHPDDHEISRGGESISHRLCYAIPDVQQERLNLLLEAQRIGAHGLLLDFCRQMPLVGYHPALLDPYMEQTGEDPRKIDSNDPADYKRWFQHRADVMTGFMRALRESVREQERMSGRPCPILARVPDAPRWLCLGYGLDVECWAADDLIDGTMIDPFPYLDPAPAFDTAFHVETMHRHGKSCIGNIGTNRLIPRTPGEEPGRLEQVFNLAQQQYEAGVDGMSLYQSEQVLRSLRVRPAVEKLGDRDAVARHATGPYEREPDWIGCDWHARGLAPAFGQGHEAL